jgi:glycolate dehydrogenase iron-sulfur subunit
MQTNFAPELLADPHMQASEKILRSCVHCGFCTATCPTYLLLGDELDSPRGRIYLIKDMLENNRPATPEVVTHIDRCLSCLSCMTTCPSGVHYAHLVDHARAHIEATYRRSFIDRTLRAALARILPSRGLFRLALFTAKIGRPLAPILARIPGLGPKLGAMLALAPKNLPPRGSERARVYPASGAPMAKRRVALLTGCAQSVLTPQTNAAAIELLTRAGVEVVLVRGEGCCGSLVHHMGREKRALGQARANIDAWTCEIAGGGLDAILITASGCGTTVKDYGFMLRADTKYAEKAARISTLAKDVTEYLATLDLAFATPTRLTVAYHSACSMQHGQKVTEQPKALLRSAGFVVREPAEGHICCGSAGTYNILQPEIAAQLRARKLRNIQRLKPDVIAAGNVGCIAQLAGQGAFPVVHTVELLNWAAGGAKPAAIA